MEFERYCDNLATELAGWRAKFDDVTRKFDKAETGDKSKVYPHVNELHMILEEFEDRIRQVKSSCATGVEPEKFEFGEKFTDSSQYIVTSGKTSPQRYRRLRASIGSGLSAPDVQDRMFMFKY
jgi:hypothetical protein